MKQLSQISPIQQIALTEQIAKALAKQQGYAYGDDCNIYEYAKVNPRAAEYMQMAEAALQAVKDFLNS